MNVKLDRIFAIVAIVLALVLGVFFVIDRQKDKKLEEIGQQQAEQERQLLSQKQAMGTEIYEDLAQSLDKSLTGIVCWGDKSMYGNKSGTLPAKLNKLIETRLFTGIKNVLLNKAKLYSVRELSMPVVNMGVINEGFSEILARTGARRMVLGEDCAIPSGQDLVNITLSDSNGKVLHFADQKYARFGEVTIGDVKGYFYDGNGIYDSLHVKLAFARDVGGEAVTFPAGTPVYTEGDEVFRSYIPILFFEDPAGLEGGGVAEGIGTAIFSGKYGNTSIEEFVRGIEDIVSIFGDGAYLLIFTTAEKSELDNALSESFQDHYIRNDKLVGNMSESDYEALAEIVYDNLTEQKVFDKALEDIEAAQKLLEDKLG